MARAELRFCGSDFTIISLGFSVGPELRAERLGEEREGKEQRRRVRDATSFPSNLFVLAPRSPLSSATPDTFFFISSPSRRSPSLRRESRKRFSLGDSISGFPYPFDIPRSFYFGFYDVDTM